MPEYKGDEILYLIEIEEDSGKVSHRFFNQTDGSHDISADSIELETKDRTGSDYGNVTETISVEGVLTQDDPAVKYIKDSIRNKRLVNLSKLDTRTMLAEKGRYMLSNFNESDPVGDFATYSIDAALNGSIEEVELSEIPAGADELVGGGNDGGVEG